MKVFIYHRECHNENSAGFSRIDLLAVAAIMILLGTVFSPAFARTRVNDQSFQCRNNLRQLMSAMLMYTHDFNDLLPPNVDAGSTTPGQYWCPGEAGMGGADEFNSDLLKGPRSMLVSYIATNVVLFHCPADRRFGRSTAPSTFGQTVLNARSVSLSGAIGTDPSTAGKLAVNGSWLNGTRGNTRNGPWLTYGKTTSIVRPSPAMVLVLVDEAAKSINDANFATTMVENSFIDCPGMYHDLGCNIAFADGHSESKSWTDKRITAWPNGQPYSPANPDVLWVQARTSALK